MLRVFVTAKFQNKENKEEIEHLCILVRKAGFEDFCFVRDVEHYQKVFDNPKELMERALKEIDQSDCLLIDMTNQPTGRAIEAGIAYAMKKRIIVIMKKGTIIKDVTRGIANVVLEYENIDEISSMLKRIA